jgi:hypothetical protein
MSFTGSPTDLPSDESVEEPSTDASIKSSRDDIIERHKDAVIEELDTRLSGLQATKKPLKNFSRGIYSPLLSSANHCGASFGQFEPV